MKISCVGAGGFYFIEVLGALAREKDIERPGESSSGRSLSCAT